MDKENLMPIVLGATDGAFLRKFVSKYGAPVIILDTQCRLSLRLSPRFHFIKMTSQTDGIVTMYINDLLEGTERIPLLAAADREYRELIERNFDALSSVCILWNENFEF